jgi:hypothetical protein
VTHKKRATIAGLMGVVLAVSVALAALRSGSSIWAGAVFLLACGVLSLAAVGSVFDTGGARVWWLGFAIFGWGYLVMAFSNPPFFIDAPYLPTDSLLRFVMPYVGPSPPWLPGAHGLADNAYLQTGHCLLGLLAGTLGGVLAHVLFSNSQGDPQPANSGSARRRSWPAVLGLTGLALLASTALAGARKAPGSWAGVMVLLTWALIGLTTVAAACGQRRRRAACMGASLFGAEYMLLVAGLPFSLETDLNRQPWPQLATNRLLNAVRPWLTTIVSEYPAGSDGVAFANARILQALDKSIPMRFPQGKTLRDLLAYVVAATRSPDGHEIPLYLPPESIDEMEETLQKLVRIDLEGVPLRTTLHLALNQCGLSYTVKGGVIIVASVFDSPDPVPIASSEPFLAIGQSLLALLAAGVGGVSAALIYDPRTTPETGHSTVEASQKPKE